MYLGTVLIKRKQRLKSSIKPSSLHRFYHQILSQLFMLQQSIPKISVDNIVGYTQMSRYHIGHSADIFYSGCPSCEQNRKHITYWYHSGCGYKTCLCYDDIHIFCSGCNTSQIIFRWIFSCKSHGFRKVQLQGIIYALHVLSTSPGREDQIGKALRLAMMNYQNY